MGVVVVGVWAATGSGVPRLATSAIKLAPTVMCCLTIVRMPGIDMRCPPKRVASKKLDGNAKEKSELQVKINPQHRYASCRANHRISMKLMKSSCASVKFSQRFYTRCQTL